MTTSPRGEVLRHGDHLFERINGQTPAILLTTDPGLEDVAAAEAAEGVAGLAGGLYERRPRGFDGHVLILPPKPESEPESGLESQMLNACLALRSIHHVIEPRYTFTLTDDEPLEQIRTTLRERGVGADPLPGDTFRVTSRRHGDHAFTSTDVQRYAGAGLIERDPRRVDLTNFDTQVRVDVRHDQVLVGLQWTRERLSARPWRVYHPRAALRANVAYAMLRFADLRQGRILDPFCGSGTIPIEAAGYSQQLEIVASDYSEDAVAGAARNMEAAGCSDRVALSVADGRNLAEIHEAGSFDAIITNPPYGIRVGQGMNFMAFYIRFLRAAGHVLRPGGRLVFLAWKRGVIDRANDHERLFKRLHVRVVETGGIYPRLYLMERR